MIQKIIIPTDGYGLEDHVIKYVARAFPSAEFHLISVVNTCERGVQLTSLLYKEMKESAEKAIERGKKLLEDERVENIKSKVLEGLPSKKIIDYASKRDADLIAMRVYSRKATTSAQRIGSTVKNVLKRSHVPVLTLANECERFPVKKVLFATDGSGKSERAKNFAILFSSYHKAELEALYVIENKEKESRGKNVLHNIEWKASFMDVMVKKSLEEGDVVEKILEHARNNDILIMGIGRQILFMHYLGHVTQAICTHSPIPVIFVRCMKKRWEKRMPRR